jgi:hypothetical protein
VMLGLGWRDGVFGRSWKVVGRHRDSDVTPGTARAVRDQRAT